MISGGTVGPLSVPATGRPILADSATRKCQEQPMLQACRPSQTGPEPTALKRGRTPPRAPRTPTAQGAPTWMPPWRRTAPRRRWRALAPSCAGAPCASSGWPDDTKFCPPPGRTMERCSSCPHAGPQGPMAIGPASCLHPPVSPGDACCPRCVPLFLSGSPCPLHLSALAASALSTARTEHGPA